MLGYNTSENNVSLVACLTYKVRQKPRWNGRTRPTCGEASDFSMLQVNTSGGMSSMARMIIPYPAAGTWHLTLRPFCYVVKKGIVNNTDVDLVQCRNSTSVVFFTITSSSCLLGGCGAFGRCYQYISGGFLFSTCVCNAGYRGWGCTDDAEAIPGSELLTATLLLTLSNILFVPAIAIAAYRRYFTEALVYACTMLFSALYHACDEEVFSVCLLRLNVLQFCDFYSAILAFWVTLLAMAHLPVPLTSLLHMAGAIGVALGIEYDRTGLAVFMVPTLSGIVILAVSWVVHCRQRHSCFPSKKYWLIYLPPGLILAAGGLICYAFFETEQNYKFVHSAWHATMALSIVFFLPFREAQAVKAKLTWRGLQM
ncbi:hypothetical protein B566_EDAN017444 [Ephemera danica]|nr:hypothetical protein B566_EDAN017444 [Ephemera danica]